MTGGAKKATVGEKHGPLTLIGPGTRYPRRPSSAQYPGEMKYRWRCDCGGADGAPGECEAPLTSVRSGKTRACSRLCRYSAARAGMPQVGARFGHLELIRINAEHVLAHTAVVRGKTVNRRSSWLHLWRCDCGNETKIGPLSVVTRGDVVDCRDDDCPYVQARHERTRINRIEGGHLAAINTPSVPHGAIHPRIADWPAVTSLVGLPRSVLSTLAEYGTVGPDGRVVASVTAAAKKRIARRLRVKPRQVGYAIRALRIDWFLVDGDSEDTVVIDYVPVPPATDRRAVA